MIEVCDPPVLDCRMTRLAVRTQRTLVFVVRFVASDACGRCILEVRRLRMARLALRVRMLSVQLETGRGMIESSI